MTRTTICQHCGAEDKIVSYVIIDTPINTHAIKCKQCGKRTKNHPTHYEASNEWNEMSKKAQINKK